METNEVRDSLNAAALAKVQTDLYDLRRNIREFFPASTRAAALMALDAGLNASAEMARRESRALAPASEAGDREKARDLLHAMSKRNPETPDADLGFLIMENKTDAVGLIAQALATERAAAWERAAQVAQWEADTGSDYDHRARSMALRIAEKIRALTATPEQPIPAPERADA